MKLLPVVFEEREIRRVYDEKTETWFFSVVDIIQVLTQQPDYQASRKYWKVLKGRLAKEGSELVTNCYQLKMAADDGKMRLTEAARNYWKALKDRLRKEGSQSVTNVTNSRVWTLALR
jgi:hypothetical protein